MRILLSTGEKHPNQEPPVKVEYVPHFEVINWSPGARIGAAAAGIAILGFGQQMKGIFRQLAAFSGVSLCLRALLNKDLTQCIGIFLSPTIQLSRGIVVDAPVDEVEMFWTKIENYPRFMSFVRKVETSRYGNLIWEIAGPRGLPIRWESYLLSWLPSRTIAWRTVPGSPIFNSERITFTPLEFAQTKIQVEIAYALRAGSLGYAATRVLGFDPKVRIESDLKKMKSLIEEEWKRKQEVELSLDG